MDWVGSEGLGSLEREEKSQGFWEAGNELPTATPFEEEVDGVLEEALEPFWGLAGSPDGQVAGKQSHL